MSFVMRKRTLATIAAFLVLTYALFVSVLLSALPKLIVLTQAITISSETPKKSFDLLFELIPRKLYWAHWEFNRFQECIYVFEGKTESYVTMLANALMTPDESRGVSMDYPEAEKILRHLVSSGCSVNSPTAETGWLPIHTAVVLLNDNPEIGYFIAEQGADFDARLPTTDRFFPDMSAREIIEKLLQERPGDKNLIKMQKLASRITSGSMRSRSSLGPPQASLASAP